MTYWNWPDHGVVKTFHSDPWMSTSWCHWRISQGMTKIIRIHILGILNFCMEINIFWLIFQSGPKKFGTHRLLSDDDLASGGNGQCFRVSVVASGYPDMVRSRSSFTVWLAILESFEYFLTTILMQLNLKKLTKG